MLFQVFTENVIWFKFRAQDFTQFGVMDKIQAVFTIKDFTIANITIHDIEITVDNRVRVPFVIGKSTLSLFGKYTIDKGTQEIRFE